jgi:hypothetical protein
MKPHLEQHAAAMRARNRKLIPISDAPLPRRRPAPWWERRIQYLLDRGCREQIIAEGLFEMRERAKLLERDRKLNGGIR